LFKDKRLYEMWFKLLDGEDGEEERRWKNEKNFFSPSPTTTWYTLYVVF